MKVYSINSVYVSLFFLAAKDSRSQQQTDRIERLRLIKERQNEEKQRKLEELRQQVNSVQYKSSEYFVFMIEINIVS